VKLTTKEFTFTIEQAHELLKEYREKFADLEEGDICNEKNEEMRETFMKMLISHEKIAEKITD
jgi:uncharacterized protein YciU (UPF0263 family)